MLYSNRLQQALFPILVNVVDPDVIKIARILFSNTDKDDMFTRIYAYEYYNAVKLVKASIHLQNLRNLTILI